jgi:CRP/FNR family transcriptional regulator, nitrogen fixation regulation protein
MRKIEFVTASNTVRQCFSYKPAFGAGVNLASRAAFENGRKNAERAVLSVRRGPIRYRRNNTIACEGDPADYVFMAVDGVVRRCKTFQNGTRAIVAFHTPGELFGWTDELTHALSIEAATDALVLFFKRNVLMSAAARDHRVASYLLTVATTELRCIQAHSVRINQSAKGRIAGFLLDLSARTGETACVDLPMSHQDVADHLGLSIETVSRTITELVRACLIERASVRTINLTNRSALAQLLS